MTGKIFFALMVLGFCLIVPALSSHLKERPIEVKLGYLPHPKVLKILVADQAPLIADFAILRVLFYYGTIIEKWQNNVFVRPEFYNMYKTLQAATQLDPYNEDAYYFVQAAFNWELERTREVNSLLEYGMKYRTWDHWLPFYAGFNYAYFLKEYDKAAYYMQRAAEISGNSLYGRLAARYFYESDQTSLGLAFLDTMIETTRDKAVKRTYEVRKEALIAVTALEQALSAYRAEKQLLPKELKDLVHAGYIDEIPDDPYGGSFYIDPSGKIRTTSKFANPDMM